MISVHPRDNTWYLSQQNDTVDPVLALKLSPLLELHGWLTIQLGFLEPAPHFCMAHILTNDDKTYQVWYHYESFLMIVSTVNSLIINK